MSNYYETLNISQSATSSEIQTAYEFAYNYWRNLVNHHDPQMVQKANQALMEIEQIRAILSDPVKRANYDASLSVGNIGGLVDTSAHSVSVSTANPPAVRTSNIPAHISNPNIVNSDSWPCAKCSSVNAVGTRYCKKCGNQLGKNCPKCNTLLEATAQFCSVCGVNILDFGRELEIKAAETERLRIIEERRIAEQQSRLAIIIKSSNNAMNLTKYGWLVSILGSCIPYVNIIAGLVGLLLFVLAIPNALKALRQSQQYGDQEYRTKAKSALVLSGIPIGLTIIGVILIIFLSIVGAFSS